MAISSNDEIMVELRCPDPKCGHPIKEALAFFHGVDRLACPNCGYLIDLHLDRFELPLRKLFGAATEARAPTGHLAKIVHRI